MARNACKNNCVLLVFDKRGILWVVLVLWTAPGFAIIIFLKKRLMLILPAKYQSEF